MGQTISEKIFSKKAGKPVKPGEIVNVELDRIMSHDSTTALAIEAFEKMNTKKLYSDKMVIVFDHAVPAPNENVANIHRRLIDFAQKNNVEMFYGQGICHQILPEKGFIKPGEVVIGADSHSCTYGAFGCFGTGMGSTDIAVGWATGQNWFRVPETIKVNVTGKLRTGVFSKDLMLTIIKELKQKKIKTNYRALEFHGQTIKDFDMSDRIVLSNMAIEAGAKTGLINADETTLNFLKKAGVKGEKIFSDDDAEFVETLEINADEIEPVVAVPPDVANVKNISEVNVPKVDQVFIGTCTNGRIEDLRIAADIVRGKHVKEGMRFIVTPASQEVLKQATKEGIINDLAQAGAVIGNTSCGPCLGRNQGILADNDVCVSTMNRNYMGRMGSPKSEIYLVSPYVAALTALSGKLEWREK